MKQFSPTRWWPGLLAVALVVALSHAHSATAANADQYLKQGAAWFATPQARRIADNILTWQAPAGAWPKNGDTVSKPYSGAPDKLSGTFDNRATMGEIRFLARAFQATKDERYRAAVLKALDHILVAQYPTGGWPQYYPPGSKTYNRYITFNDNAMVRLLETLRQVATTADFDFVDPPRRTAAQRAFDRGIACILKCQIRVGDRLTVWCAQHDEIDFRPRAARTFELVSFSGAESAGLLHLLMTLDAPSPEVQRAIQAGAAWFDSAKLTGLRQTRVAGDKVMVADPAAPPLWARFYDIPTGQPIFVGRDGVPKPTLAEIEAERRIGYSWYGPWGEEVAANYAQWSARWLKPTPPHP